MAPSLERSDLFTPRADTQDVVPAVERLGGPDWLQRRRSDAARAAAEFPLPSVEAEEWRYSRIAELDLSRYRLREDLAPADGADTDPAAVPAEVGDLLADLGPVSGVVVLVDGRIVHTEVDGGPWDAGVRFGAAADDAVGGEVVLGSAMVQPVDLFALYNDALSEQPIALDVPAGWWWSTPSRWSRTCPPRASRCCPA